MAFYQKQGFKIYGTEPRALKIGDTFFDEHLMILDLTGGAMKQLNTYLSLCTEVYGLRFKQAESTRRCLCFLS